MRILKQIVSKRRRKASGRRRKTKSRRRSTKKTTRRYGTCVIDETALKFLNSLNWDVTMYPDGATFNGLRLTVTQLNMPLCSGRMKLLVPVTAKNVDDAFAVMYELHITKQTITLKDVLVNLWKFYNFSPVLPEDLENMEVMHSQREMISQYLLSVQTQDFHLRFKDLLQGNTKFGGLIHQGSNNYTVKLADSLTTNLI